MGKGQNPRGILKQERNRAEYRKQCAVAQRRRNCRNLGILVSLFSHRSASVLPAPVLRYLAGSGKTEHLYEDCSALAGKSVKQVEPTDGAAVCKVCLKRSGA